jgi:glycosyltransferase involved in cell wall biosynthesis
VNKKLQVVMISHGFFPRIGGVERQVAAIAPRLQRRGVQVHIVTRRLPGTPIYEVFEGVPIHRLPASGPRPAASLAFTLAAQPLIRRLKPDLIHAHELISPATAALLAKRLAHCPLVVTVHRSGPPGDVQRMYSRPFGAVRLKTLAYAVDRFIVISTEIDRELAQAGIPAEKRIAIPNGVDVEKFFPLKPADRIALRSQLDLPREGKLIIYAGRLAPEKRVRLLIQAWPAVRVHHPDAWLLILGDGPEGAALQEMAGNPGGEGIRWLGAQEEVVSYLQAADGFVLPSTAEGLSVALLEAMACGLPAVATAIGGAPDVITDQVNGWLIPPDDQEALQKALLDLLADQAQRQRIGQAARDWIKRFYALDVVADRLCALYQALLEPRTKEMG